MTNLRNNLRRELHISIVDGSAGAVQTMWVLEQTKFQNWKLITSAVSERVEKAGGLRFDEIPSRSLMLGKSELPASTVRAANEARSNGNGAKPRKQRNKRNDLETTPRRT